MTGADAGPPDGNEPGPATPAGPIALFRPHLRLKVISLIVAILFLGFGVLVLLNVRREAQSLIAGHRETMRLLGDSIFTSIETDMLEGRPDIIRELVGQLKAGLRDVRRLDGYRRNGVQAFTDLETVNEVNRIAGLEPALIERITRMKREPGERLTDPLFVRAVETREPQVIEESLGGGAHVPTLFRPLRNLDKCQEYHADHQVRGVVRGT